MKIRPYLPAFLLALAMPTWVAAQDEEGALEETTEEVAAAPIIEGRPWYLSLMGSYFKASEHRATDDGFGGTFAIGKRMTDGLNLELTGFFFGASPEVGNGDDLKLSGVGATAMIFPSSTYPGLYALLSVGPGAAENQPGLIPNYKTTYFDSGIGYLYPLALPFAPKALLRAEARYHMDAHNRENAGVVQPRDNSEFYDGVFNFGFLFPIGTPAAAAPVEEAPAEEAPAGPADADNDGVPDESDQCPDTPAGAVVDEKGCEADADGDGVPDRLDTCPDTAAGTAVGADGCALDTDGDGVPDAIDECPNTPAGAKVLANGCALKDDCRTPRAGEQVDENGCAVDKAFILKGVNFEFDSDRLTDEAKLVLNEVAQTLLAYPDIKVEIAGHTDGLGSDAYNLSLSERRAISVKNYLTGQNVEAGRMTPNGYGETQPIDSNESEEGQSRNRRVELRVIEEDGGNTGLAAPVEPAPESAPAEGEVAP